MTKILSTQNTNSTKLLLYLPKFKMETTFQLNDVLIQLGMKNAFSNRTADFIGIIKKENMQDRLYISKVIHKAFIDVNEEGSEAAAATAVVLCDTNCFIKKEERPPIEFKANRPFMFIIQEQLRGITLFHGKYLSSKT